MFTKCFNLQFGSQKFLRNLRLSKVLAKLLLQNWGGRISPFLSEANREYLKLEFWSYIDCWCVNGLVFSIHSTFYGNSKNGAELCPNFEFPVHAMAPTLTCFRHGWSPGRERSTPELVPGTAVFNNALQQWCWRNDIERWLQHVLKTSMQSLLT